MSIENFGFSGGGGGGSAPTTGNIFIPTPIIKVNPSVHSLYNEQVFLTASYLPFSSVVPEEFKAHNPKFYLFRSKSRSNKKVTPLVGEPYKKNVPKGFYHPTHLDGINFGGSPVYGGSTRIPFNTEYDFGGVTPYNYTVLGFNPYEWAEFKIFAEGETWQPMTNAQWGLYPLYQYRFTGKHYVGSRSILFKIAIGINNPSGSTTNPILFGDFSPTFRLQFLTARTMSGLAFTPIKFVIQLENSTVKRKIITLL